MLRLGATLLAGSLLGVTGGGVVGSADAQGVAELFGKVAPTVVVVRALDGGADGPGRVGDIGSGVVVSKDGALTWTNVFMSKGNLLGFAISPDGVMASSLITSVGSPADSSRESASRSSASLASRSASASSSATSSGVAPWRAR